MTFPSQIDLSAIAGAGFTIEGTGDNDWAGWRVASAGDVNADGIDDFIVGAPFEPGFGGGPHQRGAAYVLFGTTEPFGTVDLAALDADDGFAIRSNVDVEQVGIDVAAAGDVDGDGIDDLIVGANGANGFVGAAYVIFGKADPFVDIDIHVLPAGEGFAINGIDPNDNAGTSVASAGDMNGDGYSEILIGVPGGNGAVTDAGAVYVLLGKAGGFADIDLVDFGASDGFVILGGAAFDGVGRSVAPAGDVDGDGYDDIIVGASAAGDAGEAYVIFGSGSGFSDVDLSAPLDPDTGFRIIGAATADYAGVDVASAGDINGDGYDDLIVGANLSNSGANDGGVAYVIFGKARDALGEIDLAALSPDDGFEIRGTEAFAVVGYSVASAGDVDGDGFDDLIVGAPGSDNYSDASDPSYNPFDAGAAFLIFGKPGDFGTIELGDDPVPGAVLLLGGQEGGYAGFSVGSAGDIDGDGFDEVIIGAPRADVDGADRVGKAHVVLGSAGTPTVFPFVFELATDVSPVAGLVLEGDGLFGVSVSEAGDFNGDGIDDVIVGAPLAGPGGLAYIIFGKDGGLGSIDPDDGVVIAADADFYSFGRSVSAAGDVNGDGIDDVIISDPAVYDGAGAVIVVYGRTDVSDGEIDPVDPAGAFAIVGPDIGGYAGYSATGAGDVNGDGLDDLIIGALESRGLDGDDQTGAVFVVYGRESRNGLVDLGNLDPSDGFVIEGLYDDSGLGLSVSSAGDFNGDGLDDMIFSAPLSFDPSDPDPVIGKTYIIFGRTEADGGIGPIDLADLDPDDGFALDDPKIFSLFGASVSGAGDVNGDGFDDVVIGGPLAADYSAGSDVKYGAAYVLFGREDGFDEIDPSALTPDDGFAILGPADPDRPDAFALAGRSVSGAGDVNGDGFDDLIVGAPYGDTYFSPSLGAYDGKAFVLFGKATGFADIDLNALTADQGFVIEAGQAGAYTGFSVSGAGDLNGDGFDDLIVGEPGSICGCGGDGKAYIIYGRGMVAADDAIGTLENSVATGSLFDDNGSGPEKASNGAMPTIAAVNGAAGNVGAILTLASGARLTVTADGSYVYDPNGRFNYLAAPGSGAANIPGSDSFTYTLANGDTATVTVTITGVDSDDILVGTGGVDVMSGGIGEDRLFGLGGHDQLHGGSAPDRLVGGDGDDLVDGGRGHDSLEGGDGNDTLIGGAHGIDRLDGGTGADTMTGGIDNDTYVVDNAGDIVIELRNQGNDRVESTIDYDLPANLERLFLMGPHHLVGRGNALDNKLFGNAGKNFLNGGGGDDVIDGGAGSDRIYGSEGNDLLIGGGGNDKFHFNTALGPDNVDLIADYTPGQDLIQLARYIFTAAGSGTLAANAFKLGNSATAGDDRILYDSATGQILYDADGTGAAAATLFALVTPGTILTSNDFYLYG